MTKRSADRFGFRRVTAAVLALGCILARPRAALAKDTEVPSELVGIDIDDRRGNALPRDVPLSDSEGRSVTVGDYLDGKRPLVIVLAYYECPMLCTMVINGVLAAMKGIPWTASQEYRTLVVSFDPRDTVAAAAAKRTSYLASYGRPVGPLGFDFDVGAPGGRGAPGGGPWVSLPMGRKHQAVRTRCRRIRRDARRPHIAHALRAHVPRPATGPSRSVGRSRGECGRATSPILLSLRRGSQGLCARNDPSYARFRSSDPCGSWHLASGVLACRATSQQA